MAGDWIKFEIGTSDKPEVWAIAQALDIDPDAVVGKILRVWSWFDQHTENGNAPIVTKKLLDRVVGVTGFCDAVISNGWMLEDSESISLPNFERHNGKTAKNRAVTAKRVAAHKIKTQESNDKGNAPIVTEALPKEEKRREDITTKKTTKKFAAADAELPSNVDRDNWLRWVDFRKSKKKPITERAAAEQLKLLSGHESQQQRAMVSTSIANDYQGLFAPRSQGGYPTAMEKRSARAAASFDFEKASNF